MKKIRQNIKHTERAEAKSARSRKSANHFKFTLTYLNDLIIDRNNVIFIKRREKKEKS